MSNLTSASGEASMSSGTRGDVNNSSGVQQMPTGSTGTGATNTSGSTQQQPPPAVKRKRSLPGNPDPDAEVIALSPKTLMTTNRFICEICSKGFQRDQNLQLHRRGHNLPWKLKQRTSKEIRKRVYICPEESCVHHDPARALGDLTGVKKHFCRKHGEKKWKCDKCSKRYAVQSDWKAHSKTCGTREYRCDCGTLFSRRDSFITHRAFCDALAEESARMSAGITIGGGQVPEINTLALGGAGAGGGAAPMSVLRGAALSPNPASFRPGAGSSLEAQFSFAMRPSMASRMPTIQDSGLSLVNPRWEHESTTNSNNNNAGFQRPRLSLLLGEGSGGGNSEHHHQLMAGPNSHHIHMSGGQFGSMEVSPSACFTQSPKSMQSMLGLSEYDESSSSQQQHQTGKGANLSSLLPVPMTSSNPGAATLYSNMLTSQQMGHTDFGVTNWTDRIGMGSAAARLSLSTSAGLTTSSSSANNNNNSIHGDSLYSSNNDNNSSQNLQQQQQHHPYIASQMSATALLQKAAQMGATAGNPPVFAAFGMAGSDTSASHVGLGLSWHDSANQEHQPQHQRGGGGGPGSLPGIQMSAMDHDSNPFLKGPMDSMAASSQSMSFSANTRSSSEHAGLHDLMNSLSGGAGGGSGFFGALNSMQFGANMADSGSYGRMMNLNAYDNNQRTNPNPNSNPVNIGSVRGSSQRSISAKASHTQQQQMVQRRRMASNLFGMGNLNPRPDQDGGDGLTRDFLGVGGAGGMVAAAQELGRTLSQREIANITNLGSGMDLVSYNNQPQQQRENSHSHNAGLSPAKSWDAS